MATHDQIKNWTERRHLVLLAMAGGWTNVRIAEEFGLAENYISTMRTSPLFQAQLGEMRAELRRRFLDGVGGLIESEAENSVHTLIEVRDTRGDGAAADRKVRVTAATEILDRTQRFAKRQQNEVEHVHRIVFSRTELAQMIAGMPAASPQSGVIDVPPSEPE